MLQHTDFLTYVSNYVEANPDIAAYVSDAVANGLKPKLNKANERAADMEVALAVMVAKRYKNRETLVLDKLKKWNNQSSLRWDDTIDMLEGVNKC